MLPVYPSSDNGGVSFNTVYLGATQFYEEANIEMGLGAKGPRTIHRAHEQTRCNSKENFILRNVFVID